MLDFNQAIKGLDGKEVKDEKDQPVLIGKLIAGALAGSNKGDALKLFNWAQKMYNGETLDLDQSDTETLKEFIKSNETFSNLAKAQALAVFKAHEA